MEFSSILTGLDPWVEAAVGAGWRRDGGRLWLTLVKSMQRDAGGVGDRPGIMHNGRLLCTLVLGRLGGCCRSASVGACDMLLANRIWLLITVWLEEYSHLADEGVLVL